MLPVESCSCHLPVAITVCVIFQSLGKILACNIRCFVENALSVMILHSLLSNCAGKGRIYCEKLGKKGQKGFTPGYQKGIRVVMLIKMELFAFFTVLSQF